MQGNETARIHDWHGAFGSNEVAEINWEIVDWGNLQQECLQRNSIRYRLAGNSEVRPVALYKPLDSEVLDSPTPSNDTEVGGQPRTAVILRTWLGMKYTENDLYHIRSMVMELSLYSGGEYEVILLIDCQGEELPAESDATAWKFFRKKHLPQELWGLAMFFNAEMLSDWYPDIDVHVYVCMVRKWSITLLTLASEQYCNTSSQHRSSPD